MGVCVWLYMEAKNAKLHIHGGKKSLNFIFATLY